jgi:ATP-dependent helicase/nuclease subunit A
MGPLHTRVPAENGTTLSASPQEKKLEPEQIAAAYSIDRHISVTAGPGSGKTTVLVERYLHILREHKLSIDQIVAITFTNRAANEMRERLRAQLNHILQTAAPGERRHWLGYKRTLDGAVITTIHGFCARLLREFPVEARVDPQFLLLDEHRAAMLLEGVVEEALTEFISSGHVEISRLTLGVGRGKLAAALAQLYREVRGQGLALPELAKKTAQSHSTEEDHALSLVELSRGMNDFLNFRRTTPAARASQTEVSTAWPGLRTLLHTIPEPDALAEYCRAVETFRNLRPQARGDLKPYVNALDELVWEKELMGRVPQLCLDLFARQYALEMVNLLSRIDERLTEEKQRLSALDFDDLELRTLELLERPEVITRAAERYKFFLVDEFQDTNGLQRRLLERLALQQGGRESANLFIVGDRKQSIYGFRGADVDVFREMTGTLLAAGGEEKPLLLNFRSQPPLINFFNHLFERLFQPRDEVAAQDLKELGYVEHEASDARRKLRDTGPLVELLVTTEASGEDDDPKAEQNSRELDAAQIAQRIIALTGPASVPGAVPGTVPGTAGILPASTGGSPQATVGPFDSQNEVPSVESTQDACGPRYSDIALLFRAMTKVQVYESAFRRANIPYQTVLGRGFYEREEITDLIQLLRFLDNKTDELGLAAMLRSPLCGISDNALLALRCGPTLDEVDAGDPLRHFTQIRKVFAGLMHHDDLAYISPEEHLLLDRAGKLIKSLIARRHHYSLGSLLRFAVEESEYLTVIAATFDGAQRLANVQRLFTLAERFERSGAHLIRDFVRYVEEFEAIGSRESEGQIDEATNAVRLMTIHQAKGLEFPIVIIPELQRYSRVADNWVLLDRHRGLTLKVPDGRGKLVTGRTFDSLEQRHARREQFEGMRLLYVAATRAEDRLILSGTTKDLDSFGGKSDTWLKWIWQSLDLPAQTQSGIVDLTDEVQLQLTLNLADAPQQPFGPPSDTAASEIAAGADSLAEAFPLLQPIEPERDWAINRFSVTQLINYQRCPRQYYFDRVLHAPSAEAIATWNDAEAPEPPANLTATLKGAVIHRFCETFRTGDDSRERLLQSFKDVTAARQAELAERWLEIDTEKVIKDLLPLADNYLASPVFHRVEAARRLSVSPTVSMPGSEAGLWSELSFRLRRPTGILTGAIDKLLITKANDGNGFDIEIIDFKTNRLPRTRTSRSSEPDSPAGGARSQGVKGAKKAAASVGGVSHPDGQIAFDFSASPSPSKPENETESIDAAIQRVAFDYQLQMQAYALAVRELTRSFANGSDRIRVTLHFLDPNVEFHLLDDLLDPAACERAIDEAMRAIVAAREPEHFPVRPATHCRMCNFLELCSAGRAWLGQNHLR